MELKKTENLEHSKVAMTVEVSAAELNKAKDKAFKKSGRNIQIPGFRKGKAPRMLVERMYGSDIFFEDAINLLLPESYDHIVEEAGIKPVGQADVTRKSTDNASGAVTLTITVSVEPDVTLGTYKGLSARKPIVSVSDEEVENELKRIARRMSRIEKVEREARIGDTVILDFTGVINDVPFDGGSAENQRLELGSNTFIPGFEDQLVGCMPGDEKDVHVTFPENYQTDELKGKAAVFHCKVHAVQEIILPEFDDEFAKDVSETADTLDDLRKEITDQLTKNKSDAAERELEDQLLSQIIETMQADIPQVMFDNEAEYQMRDFAYRLQTQGVSLQQYVQMNGTDISSFRRVFQPQAQRQVKVRLALAKIAELENIEVSDSDIDAEYARLAEFFGMDDEQIREQVQTDAIVDNIHLNRALSVIKDNANVTEVDPADFADAADAADAPGEAEAE